MEDGARRESRAQSIRLVILSLPAEKELFFPLLFLNILSVCLSNVRMGETLGCFSTYSKQGRACNQNVELDKSIGRKKMWPFLGHWKTTGYPAAHLIKFDHTTHGPARRRPRAFFLRFQLFASRIIRRRREWIVKFSMALIRFIRRSNEFNGG